MAKERRVRYRRVIQLLAAAAGNSYVTGFATGKLYQGNLKMLCTPGLNCYSCPGAVLSCPIGSLQAVIGSRTFSFSMYVFGMIVLFGALMGRAVCGFLCPFGLIQELLHKIPFPIKRDHFRGDKPLRKLKYGIFIGFVIMMPLLLTNVSGNAAPAFCKYVCPAGTLEAGVPLVYLTPDAPAADAANSLIRSAVVPGLSTGPSIGFLFYWKMGLMIAILLLSVVNYRPFCKYLCPLGALYALTNPLSLYRLRIDRAKCIACGACARVCGMCVDPTKTTNHPECVRCGDCVNVCPTAALSLGWGELKTQGAASGALPRKEGIA